MEGLGNIMMATWYGFGLEIVRIKENDIIDNNGATDDFKKELELYMSVPKSSYCKNINGEEMTLFIIVLKLVYQLYLKN